MTAGLEATEVMGPLEPVEGAEETFWEKLLYQQNKLPSRKRTDYPCTHEFAAWEYTRHNDGSISGSVDNQQRDTGSAFLPSGAIQIHPVGHFEKGLSTTRFHKGFQRRMQPQIGQDEARIQREAQKQHLSLRHQDRRRQRLGSLDKRNGFNLITGQFDPANHRCTTPFHIQPKTRETGGLSEEALRTEYILLRDSMYKFHSPAWRLKS